MYISLALYCFYIHLYCNKLTGDNIIKIQAILHSVDKNLAYFLLSLQLAAHHFRKIKGINSCYKKADIRTSWLGANHLQKVPSESNCLFRQTAKHQWCVWCRYKHKVLKECNLMIKTILFCFKMV